MMRLLGICLPLVLGPAMLVAQQTNPDTAHKAPQATTVKQPGGQASHASATKRKTSHHSRKSHARAARKRAKRAAYRPEYKDNSVEVINGDATKKVVFHDELPASAPGKKLPAGLKNVPPPMKVEVVNGTSTDTQYFYKSEQDQQNAAARNMPVVIGVQSSDTRTAGGNKNPVVKGVTSSGSGGTKSESSGGQPVTRSVSPKPKRPAYQPN